MINLEKQTQTSLKMTHQIETKPTTKNTYLAKMNMQRKSTGPKNFTQQILGSRAFHPFIKLPPFHIGFL